MAVPSGLDGPDVRRVGTHPQGCAGELWTTRGEIVGSPAGAHRDVDNASDRKLRMPRFLAEAGVGLRGSNTFDSDGQRQEVEHGCRG